MPATYIDSGDYFKGVAAAALNSGDIVFDAMNRAGVITSQTPIAVGQSYQAQAEGRVSVNAKSADTFAAGALVYWDPVAKEATSTTTNNKVMGRADAAKTGGQTSVVVLLNSSGKSA